VPNFGDFQLEFYFRGLTGVRESLPFSFAELERQAHAALSEEMVSYIAGGAGNEHTQNANVSAFDRWGIVPRMLVGAARRDLSVNLFGHHLPTPLLLAPIGVIGLCTPDGHGDLVTAKAAAVTGVPMIASTLSADPMEVVAKEFGHTPGFFQLYPPNDRELTESFIHRAGAAGFAGIVITLDTWTLGWRPRDLRLGSIPFLHGHCLANYVSDAVFRAKLEKPPEIDLLAAARKWAEIFGNPTLSWNDLPWLRSMTKLPIILKGICHPDDARRAIDGGIDGIYCSNHGGRQANGGVAALDMLPGVVKACGKTPVLFDSGVRSGEHIVKALALGATAVCIGRPYVYGLTLGGVAGIVHVLRCLLAEADLLMAIDGYPTLADLTPEALVPCPGRVSFG
jgi:lactate 2-monooxygenase